MRQKKKKTLAKTWEKTFATYVHTETSIQKKNSHQ